MKFIGESQNLRIYKLEAFIIGLYLPTLVEEKNVCLS